MGFASIRFRPLPTPLPNRYKMLFFHRFPYRSRLTRLYQNKQAARLDSSPNPPIMISMYCFATASCCTVARLPL